MAEIRERLLVAAIQALRPIVRRLLMLGVPFGQLELRIRELFVDVAEKDMAASRDRQTDSRIALVTGINRKEVKRIRAREGAMEPPRIFAMNHATSLISRWMTGAKTTDKRGGPIPLPYRSGRGPSFMKLARAVTGDLAPGVLLGELVRSGAVEMRDGLVMLRRDAYVPRIRQTEALQILAEDPQELIETILKNVFARSDERLLQRKVYYDNLGRDALGRIRSDLRREGERFLLRVNRLLSRYDRDRNPRAPGGARHYAGVGVYVFESPAPGDEPEHDREDREP